MAQTLGKIAPNVPVYNQWEADEKVDKKADKPATFAEGNLAKFDNNGNPTDAGYHFEVRNGIPCIVQYT